MVLRGRETEAIGGLLQRHPVVGVIGVRQVGKTTLARQVSSRWPGPVLFLDLEDPSHLAQLTDPLLALRDRTGLIVIDEVQRRPDLFPVLRVLADRPDRPATFLILGSASPHLLRQSSETLAGRIVYHEVSGFGMDEVGASNLQQLWARGGFPRSYLADREPESIEWRRAFIQTFLERDMPGLGYRMPSAALHRFWSMLAHYHGQVWATSEFARAFGVADTTVRRYLDALSSAMVVHVLQPWHENLGKRQVKAPKVYIADSGLLHILLGIASHDDLERHPKVGASWEGFVIAQLARRLGAHRKECWFWATHGGAELDLLVVRGLRRRGYEVKRTTSPRVTPSIRSAIADLQLDSVDLIHAGDQTYPLAPNVRAVAAARLLEDVEPLD
jgi:predicted AAA+ superfamily ATPase